MVVAVVDVAVEVEVVQADDLEAVLGPIHAVHRTAVDQVRIEADLILIVAAETAAAVDDARVAFRQSPSAARRWQSFFNKGL